MCSAPNVYMFVYTLIGAQIVPLKIKPEMTINHLPETNSKLHFNHT